MRRIIDAAGGPGVVKVVVSSNWRTDEDKYPWLVKQFGDRGIEVVGHTDVMHVHPAVRGDSLRRNLELERCLRLGSFGVGGPSREANGNLGFKPFAMPSNWRIVSWIAIDDLPLDQVKPSSWKQITYLCCFIPANDDHIVGNGWMSPPQDFEQSMRRWSKEFASSHFVKVVADAGIAGTPHAERRAIELLNQKSP